MSIFDGARFEAFVSGSEKWPAQYNTDYVSKRLPLILLVLANYRHMESEIAKACPLTWARGSDVIKNNITDIISAGTYNNIDHKIEGMFISLLRISYERFYRTKSIDDSEAKLHLFASNPQSELTTQERHTLQLNLPMLQREILFAECEQKRLDLDGIQETIKAERSNIEYQISRSKKQIEEAEIRLARYDESAKALESQYNFVALAGAFKKMEQSKSDELDRSNMRLRNAKWFVVSPLILSLMLTIYAIFLHQGDSNFLKEKLLYSFPTIISIEIILVYFFRIELKNQLSLKAQLLQLQLRYSICAFIEGYANFTKGYDRSKLEKFEALIFSGLTPDPENVPSTFDGMEQLLNLVKIAKEK